MLSSKNAIAEARSAYAALSDAEKALVTSYAVLTAAKAVVKGLSAGTKYYFAAAYAKNGSVFSSGFAKAECTTKKAVTQKKDSDSTSGMKAPVIW